MVNDCNCDPLFDVSLDVTAQGCGIACDGAISAVSSGGAMPYTYNWEDAANPGVSISTMQDVSNLCVGNYCVTVTDANGCEVTGCTQLDAIDHLRSLTLF